MEQLPQCPAVAGAEPIDQVRQLVRSLVPESAPTPYPRADVKAGPKKPDGNPQWPENGRDQSTVPIDATISFKPAVSYSKDSRRRDLLDE
jgi:hypothetical protein